ncbi:hypothetical protein K474DRAFT_1677260 [Panus rudis PR-1116 ss-1]|nr:hypothetical protein K474DRAFT_1677260 [Panus rudis PR-1116 ss-1]
MRFSSLFTFALASIAYSTALAKPLEDGAEVAEFHPESELDARYYDDLKAREFYDQLEARDFQDYEAREYNDVLEAREVFEDELLAQDFDLEARHVDDSGALVGEEDAHLFKRNPTANGGNPYAPFYSNPPPPAPAKPYPMPTRKIYNDPLPPPPPPPAPQPKNLYGPPGTPGPYYGTGDRRGPVVLGVNAYGRKAVGSSNNPASNSY